MSSHEYDDAAKRGEIHGRDRSNVLERPMISGHPNAAETKPCIERDKRYLTATERNVTIGDRVGFVVWSSVGPSNSLLHNEGPFVSVGKRAPQGIEPACPAGAIQDAISIVILDSNTERSMRIARNLREHLDVRCTTVVPNGEVTAALREHCPFDIALVSADEPELRGLSFAVSHAGLLGCPQMVFFASELSDPAVWALSEIAGDRMFTEMDIQSWLEEAGALLACLARTRRTQQEARRALERLQAPRVQLEAHENWTLYRAESRFRESYVRALLLTEGNRKAAAQRAGVPYRTFIYILSKLGMTEAARRA